MEKPSIEKVHEVMKGLGMTVFTQPYSITLCHIRTKDNKANTFNDWLTGSYFDENGVIHSVIEKGTVDAGFTYRIKPMNPKGTAIIKHGIQHRGVYQYQNPLVNKNQLGHNGKEAFRQVKNMDYWRDNDKNLYLGKSELMPDFENLPSEKSNSATNGHDMGKLGANVDNWSAGCWGSTEIIMDKFYNLAKIQISKGLKDFFSLAVLHENHFK